MATYTTVNLPQTNFPMKANLPTREPQWLEFWNTIDLHKNCENPKNSKGKFIIHDGPPYANGEIHLGHALNKILKDIINKTKLLEGYGISYIPGWDCHGLPIELNVEKKLGKIGTKISAEQFIDACRSYAAQQIQEQMAAFKRLGVMGDWEHYYSTMDFKYEANIVRSLMKIIEAGYLVRGQKPVHWCCACGSALAEAELEYQETLSPAIDVRFRVVNPENFSVTNLSVPIWTTTPWTLPANEAVALNPGYKYALVACNTLGEHLLIAEELLAAVMARYGENSYQTIGHYLGRELEGINLQHPFLADKVVPVILGDHVTLDMGTGAVHTAPAHGTDDYLLGLKYQLLINNPVGPDGKFLASTPFFAGQDIFAANSSISLLLKDNNNLIYETTLQHSYPCCWRHKTKLIFSTTKQWFIGMDQIGKQGSTLRDLALAAIEKVNWIPPQGRQSMNHMIGSRPDWCISRQRYWGIPITLFVHRETEKIHPEMSQLVQDIIAPEIEKEGLVYWHKLDHLAFLKKYSKTPDRAADYIKVTDSLDVWFNSGVSHQCVLSDLENLHFPADLYVEGSDQYRGWFQSGLLTAVAMRGEAPYRGVITHGFCVDAKGHKMSKSLGNVISPKRVVDQYGADILRLWAGSTYLHDDLAASDEIFKRNTDFYRTLRNTARFLLGNLFDFNRERDAVAIQDTVALDRLALEQFVNLVGTIRKHYDNYQLYTAMGMLHTKLVNEVSGFYFSIIKDRLYTMAPASHGRRSVQTVLSHMLEMLVRIIAPILSFTAEEIWQEMRNLDATWNISSRSPSVFMSGWQDLPMVDDMVSKSAITAEDWENIQKCRTVVNKALEQLRADGLIGSSLEAEVTLYAGAGLAISLAKLKDEIRFMLITSAASVYPINLATDSVVTTELPELKLLITKTTASKCTRCWHYHTSVGSHSEHPELCSRCFDNLFGEGEKREFA